MRRSVAKLRFAAPPRALAERGWVCGRELLRGPTGRPLCRWCGREITDVRRTTFCSGSRARFWRGDVVWLGTGCVHEWLIRSNPGYARQCVYARDRGVCGRCGLDTGGCSGKLWQAHHRVAVAEGGGSCGLDNLLTLCHGCHREETRQLRARLRGDAA